MLCQIAVEIRETYVNAFMSDMDHNAYPIRGLIHNPNHGFSLVFPLKNFYGLIAF